MRNLCVHLAGYRALNEGLKLSGVLSTRLAMDALGLLMDLACGVRVCLIFDYC